MNIFYIDNEIYQWSCVELSILVLVVHCQFASDVPAVPVKLCKKVTVGPSSAKSWERSQAMRYLGGHVLSALL